MQTFIELTNDTSSSVPCQAGFVPPLPSFSFEQEHQDHSLGSSDSSSSESWATPPPSTADELTIESINNNTHSTLNNNTGLLNSSNVSVSSAGSNSSTTSRRNMGGRRPKNQSNLSPEEEAKRKVRRERNKLAAARCRKRRVDQTNELCDKVSVLEQEKNKLQNEIQELQGIKEDLEFCLDSHRAQCRLTMNGGGRKSPIEFKQPHPHTMGLLEKIKVEPMDSNLDDQNEPPPPKRIFLSGANPIMGATSNNQSLNTPPICKPSRPSSLNVQMQMTPSQAMGLTKNIADIGIQITTPSTGVMFNFDSLMDGGTGLTPVSQPLMPTCSTHNKNPLDLATPTSEPSKLVSL